MKLHVFPGIAALAFCLNVWGQAEVHLAVHKTFKLSRETITQFEKTNDAEVLVIMAGSNDEILSKLILGKANPITNAVYGLDSANIDKARQAGILVERQPESAPVSTSMPVALAVNCAYVALNYDKEWFEKYELPLPKTMQDLAKPEYKDLLVVPNPATSSTGLAFLLANIGGMGEEAAFKQWTQMRQNGVEVTDGWGEAYYADFTHSGGVHPLVVSYAISPTAEMYFSKGRSSMPPIGNLFLKSGVFRQVEGAAVLKDAKQPVLAAKLVQWLQGGEIQKALSTEMQVYPTVKNAPLPKVFEFTQTPQHNDSPGRVDIDAKQKQWFSRWTRTVLKQSPRAVGEPLSPTR